VIRLDRHIERWIVGHRAGWLNWLFVLLSHVGAYGAIWLAVAVVLGALRRQPALFVQVLAADASAELLSGALKWAIPRHRPRLHSLVPMPHGHSFPSGHAATSFACATVIAGAAPRWRLACYALAALIAFSRLYNGVHFPLDVIAGAALGIAIGFAIRALRRRGALRRRSPQDSPAG